MVIPKNAEWWKIWNKTTYVEKCPKTKVLWIDADCVVCGDISELIEQTERGLFFVRHPHYAGQFVPQGKIYDIWPVKEKLPPEKGINSGVFGVNKHSSLGRLLLCHCFGVLYACAVDKDLAKSFIFFDESILYWLVERLQLQQHIIQDPTWDVFWKGNVSTKEQFLEVLQKAHNSGAKIMHFSNSCGAKLWEQWQ